MEKRPSRRSLPRHAFRVPGASEPRMSTAAGVWNILVVVLTAYAMLRVVVIGAVLLVPDEAYYWSWSRVLAWGYLDHPPMVAWLIHVSTSALGDSELGVRLPTALLGTLTIALVILLTQITATATDGSSTSANGSADGTTPKTERVARAMLVAALILLCSPLLVILSTIATPDTPTCFFSALTLTCATSVFRTQRPGARQWLWIFSGVALGLALLSKYTAILVGFSILLALLTHEEGRRELRRPWPWIGAVLALAVFSPVIQWNAAHHWASFYFQLHHGSTSDRPPSLLQNLLLYVGGQMGTWTPVLFIVSLVLLVKLWRSHAVLPMSDRILLVSATVPLIFFLLTSLRHEPEVNWPAFAYLPLTVLLARRVAWHWNGPWFGWTKIGVIVSLCGAILIHLPQVMNVIPARLAPHVPGRWRDIYGWPALAQQVQAARQDSPVFASTYETAAELQFYLPDRPMVQVFDSDRPTAYDFFPDLIDPLIQPRILFVRRGRRDASDRFVDPVPLPLQAHFPFIQIQSCILFQFKRPVLARQILICSKTPLDTPTLPMLISPGPSATGTPAARATTQSSSTHPSSAPG